MENCRTFQRKVTSIFSGISRTSNSHSPFKSSLNERDRAGNLSIPILKTTQFLNSRSTSQLLATDDNCRDYQIYPRCDEKFHQQSSLYSKGQRTAANKISEFDRRYPPGYRSRNSPRDSPRKTIIKPQQICRRIEFLCFVSWHRALRRCSSISHVHRGLLAIDDHHDGHSAWWEQDGEPGKKGYRPDLSGDSYQLYFSRWWRSLFRENGSNINQNRSLSFVTDRAERGIFLFSRFFLAREQHLYLLSRFAVLLLGSRRL